MSHKIFITDFCLGYYGRKTMSKTVQRVDRPDHPDRCEASTAKGQCWVVKVEGSRFCKMHGGYKNERKEANRMYKLTKYRGRLAELKNNSDALSLRDEIGIARITLEEVINKCDDAVMLTIHAPKIDRLVTTIAKLVVEAKKLEAGLGKLLDRQVVMALASQIIDVVASVVTDEEALEQIAKGIELALEQTILGVT